MKLCKDCQHFDRPNWCMRSAVHEPVYGMVDAYSKLSAHSQRRLPTFLGGCGKQARYFEPVSSTK